MAYFIKAEIGQCPIGWQVEPTEGYTETTAEVYWLFSANPDYVWNGATAVAPPTPEPYTPSPEEIKAQLTAALDNFINETFQKKGYDSRITVAMRTGYPGPWQAECVTMSLWMDSCYAAAYQIMESVQAGLRAIPTWAELKAELPVPTF